MVRWSAIGSGFARTAASSGPAPSTTAYRSANGPPTTATGPSTRSPPSSRAPLAERGSASLPILDPRQDVLGHAHQVAVLVDDLDLTARAPLDRIDLGDGVGERDRVAEEDRTQEAHLVIAERHRRLVAREPIALLDHHGRAGRGIADHQRAVRDALSVLGALHVLLVDVVHGQIASDAGEQVDV